VHELAEVIDGIASSIGEANLFWLTRLPLLPGMNGPVNECQMEEVCLMLETFQSALEHQNGDKDPSNRIKTLMEIIQEVGVLQLLNNRRLREESGQSWQRFSL
jgi:hypothetical protein